ncbi:TetR/AcrR family transcriptional regulator [Chitinophaga horti]|uniref:TetR/AcrR family transcriptional regulator n=1 Tax=Chitinophaga horti TaxID=2920382 RepID=A0ABY6IYH4_9BACT|nr:TetR/AcrR family transcriptional regulator [Chitinophaga horti]UYQ91139.1 TetR/AcrR family transcriptional regulator [Chitinophaga horti]
MSKSTDTRAGILQQAFELIYQKGYQATSIDEIIARTNVTKGAFFYHFKNKEEMGLAVIDEILYTGITPYMEAALSQSGDIRRDLYTMMEGLLLKNPFFIVEYGCPAVNMIEEMAPLNESFKKALVRILDRWQAAIEQAVKRAQAQQQLSAEHRPKQLATYIISNYAGIRNTGKLRGKGAYKTFLAEYKRYLEQLI